jgi:hypothetical protein
MLRNHALVAAGLVLSAILSGCGGDGSSSATVSAEQQQAIDTMRDQMLQKQVKGKRGGPSSPVDQMRASMIRKMK